MMSRSRGGGVEEQMQHEGKDKQSESLNWEKEDTDFMLCSVLLLEIINTAIWDWEFCKYIKMKEMELESRHRGKTAWNCRGILQSQHANWTWLLYYYW